MFELTESALLEPDPIVDANVQRLGDAGFALAIDDFGTGYSSLAYLKRLAVDRIKIDRMFVQDLEDDENDRTLVRTIVRMATELGHRRGGRGRRDPRAARVPRGDGLRVGAGLPARPARDRAAGGSGGRSRPADPRRRPLAASGRRRRLAQSVLRRSRPASAPVCSPWSRNGCAVDDRVVDAARPLDEPRRVAGEVVDDLGDREPHARRGRGR